MKYIREKDGKKIIVEKKKHSRSYVISAVVKWTVCIFVLFLAILLCLFLNKKMDGIGLIEDVMNHVEDSEGEGIIETESTEEVKKEYFTVCLDPGHGGMDRGNQDAGREEAIDNMNLALKMKADLEAANIAVVMTRTEDVKVTLKERVAIANASGADYFVSLHRNHGEGYGVETWLDGVAKEEEQTLGNNIQTALVTAGVQRDRGVKTGSAEDSEGGYYVVKNTTMPAALIENGFMNNEQDNLIYDEKLDAYAQAMAEAVIATYEAYHGTAEEGRESLDSTETAAFNSKYKGMVLDNAAIANVSSLSGECLNWGQGSNVDSLNRPTGSIQYQEKFAGYSADFIKETEEKVIYLTLDEGYEYGCTPSILKTLKEKNVKAVFFVTKPYAQEDPDLVRNIIDDGHILGNHSVTHPANGLPSQTIDEQEQEVVGNHTYIKEEFGYDMFLFRFPAGKFSEQSLAILNNCGYRSVFWSFAYLDYDVNNQPDESESLAKLVSKLHPGAIYLLHAESWTNTNILGDFIDQARAAGYEFGNYADTLVQ